MNWLYVVRMLLRSARAGVDHALRQSVSDFSSAVGLALTCSQSTRWCNWSPSHGTVTLAVILNSDRPEGIPPVSAVATISKRPSASGGPSSIPSDRLQGTLLSLRPTARWSSGRMTPSRTATAAANASQNPKSSICSPPRPFCGSPAEKSAGRSTGVARTTDSSFGLLVRIAVSLCTVSSAD